MRNYLFFDSPTIACITMNKDLSGIDAMSVGMFIQTFMLALTERGLGSCLQVSVTGYPELLRREFGLKEDQMVLCGMAIGYPAEGHKVNDLHVPRRELEHCRSMALKRRIQHFAFRSWRGYRYIIPEAVVGEFYAEFGE
ncbi:hypothetical protein AC579_440 [Pseudocercospora musae]|uniref:Nitroreductase domain-containing protein n=1 Tax=Pseudocercospora musae TaxID=113226 RepID=A0A139I634_9PEZI|nr:hypothetical protein AC579_440 [Pseudocercospora musae]